MLCLRLFLFGCLSAAALHADDRLFIEAKVNDQPLKLAFDTGAGAGAPVIFHDFATRHGIKIIPASPDIPLKPGNVRVSFTEAVKLELQGHTYLDAQLGVVDTMRDNPWDIDGLIGWPVTRNNIWLINGSSLKLIALAEVPPETAGWLKFREIKDSQTLFLALPQPGPGATASLGIDTGADDGVELSDKAWYQWRRAHLKQPVILEAYSMAGADLVITELAWADEIEIGGLILRGVPVTVMAPMTQRGRPDAIAMLGLAALKRMDTVLDGKNGVAYFRPLITPPPPYKHNRLGAIFTPTDPETSSELLAHVAKGSPAEEAGVRDGDILLKIDQLDVTPWRSHPDILAAMKESWVKAPGTKIRLTLRRGGKTLLIDVVLRNILGPEDKPA